MQTAARAVGNDFFMIFGFVNLTMFFEESGVVIFGCKFSVKSEPLPNRIFLIHENSVF